MYKGLIKFSATADWNWDTDPVQLIHNVNTLTKAGADNSELRTEKTAGQTDALVIALGAYEGTGANRNGDIFKEAECLKNYKTFIKSGSKSKDGKYDGRALNRHHKNKPEDPKYGNIKAATYNDKMKRIELVIGLDNDKCAEEIQKLAEGKQINVSMAAKVAYDKCTWCGHEAKTDNHRCKHIPNSLGEINKKGEMCSMDNINPQWFELSIVGRPADRIGMSLKLASDSAHIKTAADYKSLYPGFVAPYDGEDYLKISKYAQEKRSLVKKLAALEKHIEGVVSGSPKDSKDKFIAEQKGKLNHSEDISESAMDELRKYEPAKLLKALADNGIVFSPKDFVKYLFGSKALGKSTEDMFSKMKKHLPSMFSDLEEDGDRVVNEEKYEPSHSDILPQGLMKMIRGLFENHSLFDAPSHGRIMRITVIKKMPTAKLEGKSEEKALPKEAAIKELSQQYAAYKLAALRYMEAQDKLDDETLINVLVQNR
jgi:hypothetical protein